MGDSNGTVRHVEIEAKSSALVEMLKRHVRTIERITDLKLTSHSNMMIILSSSIFEPSQHSVAVTVYHVVIYVQAIDLLWYQFKFIPHIGCVNVYKYLVRKTHGPHLMSELHKCVGLTQNIHPFMGLCYKVIFSDGLVRVKTCSLYIRGMYM